MVSGRQRLLRSLPDELAEYKGLSMYRETAVQWLTQYDEDAVRA